MEQNLEIKNRELLEISTKIEREGMAFYIELAKHVTDPEIKDFLNIMAKEEAQHEKDFKRILDDKQDDDYGWEDKADVRELIDKHFQTDLFPKVDEIMKHLPRFEGLQKALDSALESEQISAEFYAILGEYCEDLEAKTSIVLLEKEEIKHRENILKIKQRFSEKSS